MTPIQERISTDRFSESWKSITNLTPTAFTETIQTTSSPEDTASSLNAAEVSCLKERGDWHASRKYGYPHWKVCQSCRRVFPTTNRYQAQRNMTCGPDCAAEAMRGPRPHVRRPPEERDGTVEVECATCGKEFWKYRSQAEQSENDFCSYQCNGVARGREWKAHAHKGRRAWTEESEQALIERMTGDTNPSWKGGVTYMKRKGNYRSPRYVRCPEEFLDMARKDGYVMEHRLFVAQELGRCLERTEVVHHVNHDPRDNRLENLMLFESNRDHKLFEHHGEPEPVWRGSSPADIAA